MGRSLVNAIREWILFENQQCRLGLNIIIRFRLSRNGPDRKPSDRRNCQKTVHESNRSIRHKALLARNFRKNSDSLRFVKPRNCNFLLTTVGHPARTIIKLVTGSEFERFGLEDLKLNKKST